MSEVLRVPAPRSHGDTKDVAINLSGIRMYSLNDVRHYQVFSSVSRTIFPEIVYICSHPIGRGHWLPCQVYDFHRGKRRDVST